MFCFFFYWHIDLDNRNYWKIFTSFNCQNFIFLYFSNSKKIKKYSSEIVSNQTERVRERQRHRGYREELKSWIFQEDASVEL